MGFDVQYGLRLREQKASSPCIQYFHSYLHSPSLSQLSAKSGGPLLQIWHGPSGWDAGIVSPQLILFSITLPAPLYVVVGTQIYAEMPSFRGG